MAALSIIWHSRTGASKQVAEAMHKAASAHCEVALFAAEDTQAEQLIAAQALLFVAPENLGSLSGAMKEMFDRCYYPCFEQLTGKSFAAVICAGSAGTGALRQLRTICTGWRLKEVVESCIVRTDAQSMVEILAAKQLSAEQLAPALDIALTLAARIELGLDA